MTAFELGPMANQVNGTARKIMDGVNKYIRQHPPVKTVSVSKNDYAELLAGVNRVLERKHQPATDATTLAHGTVIIKALP